MRVGERCPPFELPGVDGRPVGLEDFAGSRALVVAFWSSRCPEALAVERRVVAWADEARKRGVGVALLDADRDETLARMAARARERAYPFRYLRDEGARVAKRFGVAVAPRFLLFDARFLLCYHGGFDALPVALDALLSGAPIRRDETPSPGCPIPG